MLFVFAALGFSAILPSYLPQYLIRRFVFNEDIAYFDWRQLFTCPVCMGFWIGVFIGVCSWQNPILTGLAFSGVIGTYNWLKNVLYAWAWAIRARMTTNDEFVITPPEFKRVTNQDKPAEDPLVPDYSRFEKLVRDARIDVGKTSCENMSKNMD